MVTVIIMRGFAIVIPGLICMAYLLTVIDTRRCPGDIQRCSNVRVDCTNLNITLQWKVSNDEQYHVLYCDKVWIEVPECKNMSNNQCHISSMIPEAHLDNTNAVKIVSGNNGTECGLDFLPYSCVIPGAPDIVANRSKKREIFVTVAAPQTPYINTETGDIFRLDDSHFALEKIKYVATLRPLVPEQNESTSYPDGYQTKELEESTEFHFNSLKPATTYEIDIFASLGYKKQGVEHATIQLKTKHAGLPTVSCPPDITVKVEPRVNGTHVYWKEATAKDIYGQVLIPFANKINGSFFTVGRTPQKVTYKAVDDAENEGNCSFEVVVIAKALGLAGRILLILSTGISSITLAVFIFTKIQLDKSKAKFKDINLSAWLSGAQRKFVQNRESALKAKEFLDKRSFEREVFDKLGGCETGNMYISQSPLMDNPSDKSLSENDPELECESDANSKKHGEQTPKSERNEDENGRKESKVQPCYCTNAMLKTFTTFDESTKYIPQNSNVEQSSDISKDDLQAMNVGQCCSNNVVTDKIISLGKNPDPDQVDMTEGELKEEQLLLNRCGLPFETQNTMTNNGRNEDGLGLDDTIISLGLDPDPELVSMLVPDPTITDGEELLQ